MKELLELEAKNRSQAQMIAGYIALIEAAKDIGVHFHWQGKNAVAELPGERKIETWPQSCHLCGKNMESGTDRAEWHGLGNCVRICPMCMGSGSAEIPTKVQHALKFVQAKGLLAEALGLTVAEIKLIDATVNNAIAENWSTMQLLEYIGAMELTDECWATFLYTFGFWDGRRRL